MIGKGIGFVSDFRCMNVGITRARASMLVVGSASTLMQDKHWSNLVKSAQQRKCMLKVSKPYQSFFSDESLAAIKKINKEDRGKERNETTPNIALQMEEIIAVESMEVDQQQNNVEDDLQDDADGNDEDIECGGRCTMHL